MPTPKYRKASVYSDELSEREMAMRKFWYRHGALIVVFGISTFAYAIAAYIFDRFIISL